MEKKILISVTDTVFQRASSGPLKQQGGFVTGNVTFRSVPLQVVTTFHKMAVFNRDPHEKARDMQK
ncbi:MAG: hypothetical protein MZV70_58870 [Desulfobacterales bacterium]|nr:hypothetical protein [Desulfobacterales bacterium]